MSWMITGLSLFATWLNIKKKRTCFIIWIFTNLFWCCYDGWHGLYAQAILFFIYFGLAIYGVKEWKDHHE